MQLLTNFARTGMSNDIIAKLVVHSVSKLAAAVRMTKISQGGREDRPSICIAMISESPDI